MCEGGGISWALKRWSKTIGLALGLGIVTTLFAPSEAEAPEGEGERARSIRGWGDRWDRRRLTVTLGPPAAG